MSRSLLIHSQNDLKTQDLRLEWRARVSGQGCHRVPRPPPRPNCGVGASGDFEWRVSESREHEGGLRI